MEDDFTDVKLKRNESVVIIELKSDPMVRFAVRKAIGQLLEYAFRSASKGERIGELVVVAPGHPDELDLDYLRHLKEDRKLPVRYVEFTSGSDFVDI
jgi:hypothetical protein